MLHSRIINPVYPVITMWKQQVAIALVLLIGACGIALALSTYVRRRRAKGAPPELSDNELAYLMGGPARALEMAIFTLARDSWIRADGQGRFHVLFEEAGEQLSALETELFNVIVQRKNISTAQILRLNLPALTVLDGSLVEHHLILDQKRFQLSGSLAVAPLGLGILYGIFLFLKTPSGPDRVALGTLIVIAGFLFSRLQSSFQRITEDGERLTARTHREIRQRKTQRSVDVDAAYDQLWSLKDAVLIHGLRALVGSSFAPASTFVHDNAAEQKTG